MKDKPSENLKRLIVSNIQLIPYQKGLQQDKRQEWESNLYPVQALVHKSNLLLLGYRA